MPSIEGTTIRKILDSRGNPTVEVDVRAGNAFGRGAAAMAAGRPLYRYLGTSERVTLPLPFGNVIGGGRHAIGGTTIQEYLVVSQGPTALDNVLGNARAHRAVRESLEKRIRDEPLGR